MDHEPMRGMFAGFDLSASGLRAQLRRSEIAAQNLANMHVTMGPDGEPYRRRQVVFEEVLDDVSARVPGAERVAGGVTVAEVVEDHTTPFVVVHDPGHPHADADGFVRLPNVDLFRELVEMSMAERSYQSNLAAVRSYRAMLEDTLANFR
ncbi:MAG: flagellar basal body rod protein FlgC [Planctomycetes bacterium]|nr:flagellar basal body rod protein FlgC [Planctomycetota bacterium]